MVKPASSTDPDQAIYSGTSEDLQEGFNKLTPRDSGGRGNQVKKSFQWPGLPNRQCDQHCRKCAYAAQFLPSVLERYLLPSELSYDHQAQQGDCIPDELGGLATQPPALAQRRMEGDGLQMWPSERAPQPGAQLAQARAHRNLPRESLQQTTSSTPSQTRQSPRSGNELHI